VKRCNGKVRYFQSVGEPNSPIFWDGTADEMVAHVNLFYKAVKAADPTALVALPGSDGLFAPPGQPMPVPSQAQDLAFFDKMLDENRDAFDVFDLHLYSDPYTIPWRINYFRERMRHYGYEKPIINTEYHGPTFFEFQSNLQYALIAATWINSILNPGAPQPTTNLVKDLADKRSTLATETQMFLPGAPKEQTDRIVRIAARDMVIRNCFIRAEGITTTMFWDFWRDNSNEYDFPYVMHAQLRMMDMRDGKLIPLLLGMGSGDSKRQDDCGEENSADEGPRRNTRKGIGTSDSRTILSSTRQAALASFTCRKNSA